MCICVYILTYMNNSFEIGAANGVFRGHWSIWRAVGAPISNERATAFTVQGELRQGAREHTSLGYQMSETDSLSTGIYNVKHSERECLGPFHPPGSSHDPSYRHVCLEQSPTRKAPAPDPVIEIVTVLNRHRRERSLHTWLLSTDNDAKRLNMIFRYLPKTWIWNANVKQ